MHGNKIRRTLHLPQQQNETKTSPAMRLVRLLTPSTLHRRNEPKIRQSRSLEVRADGQRDRKDHLQEHRERFQLRLLQVRLVETGSDVAA